MTASPAERARAWVHDREAAVCDRAEPWAHGTVLRASRHPDYWDYNLVRVEEETEMSAEALAAVADAALADARHRRIDVEAPGTAARLRGDFNALGWTSLRLVLMLHEGPVPPGASAAVTAVPYDAVQALRVAWHQEDFPGLDPTRYLEQARDVALSREVQVLVTAGPDGAPTGYAQLERHGGAAEVGQVFVLPAHRGGGLGTALTRAAIAAAGDVTDLWIAADDEDRPKELYARLGFRPAWTLLELTRPPG